MTKENTTSIVSITTPYYEWSMESSEIKFWEHFLLYVEFYRIEYDLIESRIHSDISDDIYSGSIGRVAKKTIKKSPRRVVKRETISSSSKGKEKQESK